MQSEQLQGIPVVHENPQNKKSPAYKIIVMKNLTNLEKRIQVLQLRAGSSSHLC
jgi:hypothetical protein